MLNGLITMGPLVLVLVFLFVTMGRRQKKESEARSHLKKGDRVMTNAGLVGELVDMDDRLARVKIAPGVTVQIVANTVSPFVEPAPAPAKDAKALAEKK
jgi:preprotein translocase subunit YajC